MCRAEPPPGPGPVRTTRRRSRSAGRASDTIDALGEPWMVPLEDCTNLTRLANATDHRAALLDIGVGSGTATLAWARARPDALVLAVEVHRPSIARLLDALERDPIPNIRVLEADALQLLASAAPGSLEAIQVLFPDPWPKRRHIARRMVDRSFAAMVADALVPGAELLLATDWPDYAGHIGSMLATERRLAVITSAVRPPRPVTTYERRGMEAGRAIADIRYYRRPGPSRDAWTPR